MTVYLEITACRNCPHLKREQYLTPDSFDTPEFNWFCEKANHREIAKYVDIWDEDPEIPDWCPLPQKP